MSDTVDFFRSRLDQMIDLRHPLAVLASRMQWQDIEAKHRGKRKQLNAEELKLLKRRQAIEPVIGHIKQDHRLDRCHLKGEQGDRLHTVLCAAGFNFRWLLRMIAKKGVAFCCENFLDEF